MNPADLFARPALLPLLLAGPAAWLWLRGRDRARERSLVRVAGPRLAGLAGGTDPRRRSLRRGLFAGGVLLALAALAGPAWGEGPEGVRPRGADVVVCLDVSRSMLARDAAPDRLGRAKEEIAALARRASGDRLALVAFAGEARLRVPLTTDAATFAALAATADPLSVDRGGTDLAAALEAAGAALAGRGEGPAAVILLSDGEDHGGGGRRAAAALRERGIAVHAVGLGSERGGKITVPGRGGETFLRDREGREVVTALDPVSLAAVAAAGGGEFIRAGGGGELAALHERSILPASRRAFEDAERRARTPRHPLFLLGAFLLWSLDLCLTDRRR